MQVYKGFPVLTNQPWQPEDRPDLHDLVGFVEPTRSLTAAEYARLATRLIDEQVGALGSALVAGGSGLYMRATLAPLATAGPADAERRKALEECALLQGAESLHARLAALDPQAAAQVDCRNTRRLVRALEVAMDGAAWSGRSDLWQPEYTHPTLVAGLTMEASALAVRIRGRTEVMLKSGAVDEVRSFCETAGPEASAPGGAGITSAIGYRQIWGHLQGGLGLDEVVVEISTATRQYARRQMTWLRKVGGAVMIDTQERAAAGIAREILTHAEAVRARQGA